MAPVTEEDFKRAEQRGNQMLADEPRAKSAAYNSESGRIELELDNGCFYAFPAQAVQDLQEAQAADLREIRVEGLGFDLYFPRLDVDLYVPALIAGIFGTREWMSRQWAREAGQRRSPAKAAAARANGAKGGRPRKLAV